MKRFTMTASAAGLLLLASCLFLTGCGQSGSGDKTGLSDAKMSAMEKDHMMAVDKMADGKMSDGKMSTDKMADGKMSDGKMAGK